MPLAIEPAGFDAWLDPGHTGTDGLRRLLRTPAGGDFSVRTVSTAVNNVRSNGPELLAEVPDPARPTDSGP